MIWFDGMLSSTINRGEIIMKLATRINSFLPKYDHDLSRVFKQFHKLGLTHVDLNFPEHTKGYTAKEMKALLEENDLCANGVALRFREEFISGELGNHNQEISEQALILCKEAVDYCREIGGEVVTIWLGFDGFDYSFQINYEQVWQQIQHYLRIIAEYAVDIQVSVEYKPFQPRAYAFIDSLGLALTMVNDINKANLGITLDYCHMLMKHENPAYGASILGSRGKLFGIHLNDGYGLNDDGLMIGSNSLVKTVEFLYYAKLHHYQHAIYFDTFPVIEDPDKECQKNMDMIKKLDAVIEKIGMDEIRKVIEQNDAIAVSELIMKFIA